VCVFVCKILSFVSFSFVAYLNAPFNLNANSIHLLNMQLLLLIIIVIIVIVKFCYC